MFIQFETLQKDYWLGLRYMSYGITAASAALFFFITWAWKWPWVARSMRRSVVHGIWVDRLQSDFKKEEGGGAGLAYYLLHHSANPHRRCRFGL